MTSSYSKIAANLNKKFSEYEASSQQMNDNWMDFGKACIQAKEDVGLKNWKDFQNKYLSKIGTSMIEKAVKVAKSPSLNDKTNSERVPNSKNAKIAIREWETSTKDGSSQKEVQKAFDNGDINEDTTAPDIKEFRDQIKKKSQNAKLKNQVINFNKKRKELDDIFANRTDDKIHIINGDSANEIDKVGTLFDAVVTDPPYGIGIGNHDWDSIENAKIIWNDVFGSAYESLVEAGYLISIGDTKTFDLMVASIRDQGFEIVGMLTRIKPVTILSKCEDINPSLARKLGIPIASEIDGNTGVDNHNEPICIAQKPRKKKISATEQYLVKGNGLLKAGTKDI